MSTEHEHQPHPPDENDDAAAPQHAPMMHDTMSGGHAMPMPTLTGDHELVMWQQGLWAHFVNLLLGVWLVTSPSALGYRSAGLTRSYVASGALVILFSLLSYSRRRAARVQWANCFIGIWLLFAPLVFWAPTSVEYTNDTLVGALVIAFAVLVSGMPGMDMSVMMTGPDIPPGWSYNPSTWVQRAPIILLAAVGFFASRYMTAFQLGHIDNVWDPFRRYRYLHVVTLEAVCRDADAATLLGAIQKVYRTGAPVMALFCNQSIDSYANPRQRCH